MTLPAGLQELSTYDPIYSSQMFSAHLFSQADYVIWIRRKVVNWSALLLKETSQAFGGKQYLITLRHLANSVFERQVTINIRQTLCRWRLLDPHFELDLAKLEALLQQILDLHKSKQFKDATNSLALSYRQDIDQLEIIASNALLCFYRQPETFFLIPHVVLERMLVIEADFSALKMRIEKWSPETLGVYQNLLFTLFNSNYSSDRRLASACTEQVEPLTNYLCVRLEAVKKAGNLLRVNFTCNDRWRHLLAGYESLLATVENKLQSPKLTYDTQRSFDLDAFWANS